MNENNGGATILEQIAHLEAEAHTIRDLRNKTCEGLLAKPNDPTLALQMVSLQDLLKSRSVGDLRSFLGENPRGDGDVLAARLLGHAHRFGDRPGAH